MVHCTLAKLETKIHEPRQMMPPSMAVATAAAAIAKIVDAGKMLKISMHVI